MADNSTPDSRPHKLFIRPRRKAPWELHGEWPTAEAAIAAARSHIRRGFQVAVTQNDQPTLRGA